MAIFVVIPSKINCNYLQRCIGSQK